MAMHDDLFCVVRILMGSTLSYVDKGYQQVLTHYKSTAVLFKRALEFIRTDTHVGHG